MSFQDCDVHLTSTYAVFAHFLFSRGDPAIPIRYSSPNSDLPGLGPASALESGPQRTELLAIMMHFCCQAFKDHYLLRQRMIELVAIEMNFCRQGLNCCLAIKNNFCRQKSNCWLLINGRTT